MNRIIDETFPFKTENPKKYNQLPAEIFIWTPSDYDILMTLTSRVRMVSLSQAVAIWWPESTFRVAKRLLRRLCHAGFLETTFINVEPLISVHKPICSWKPGKEEPDLKRVSRKAKSRWSNVAKPQQVFFASRRSSNLFGSSAPGLPPAIQRDHDLLLADVYVYYRTQRPKHAEKWIGEDRLAKAGYQQKDPDAFLINDDGYPTRVIESAGRYGLKQVESFHEYCDEYDLPYELW